LIDGFKAYCRKQKLEVETIAGREVAYLSYIAVLEYNLKRKDRLIAEQGNQIAILNELSHRRNGEYDASQSKP
jgi:hypothetical protein